jgi:hypothetical protein
MAARGARDHLGNGHEQGGLPTSAIERCVDLADHIDVGVVLRIDDLMDVQAGPAPHRHARQQDHQQRQEVEPPRWREVDPVSQNGMVSKR